MLYNFWYKCNLPPSLILLYVYISVYLNGEPGKERGGAVGLSHLDHAHQHRCPRDAQGQDAQSYW